MSHKKQEITDKEILLRIKEAGISDKNSIKNNNNNDQIEELPVRLKKILSINNNNRKSTNMLCFVMYDIESNKVRPLIAKYLLAKGCYRIQKSIFLGDIEPEVFNKIKTDLAEVQAAYDNNDSILILPVSTDYIKSMKIIGQKIDVDLILQNKNTLFF